MSKAKLLCSMDAIFQAAFLVGKTAAWGNMCRKQRKEESGKWRMTAEALPTADSAVSLLVGCQHLSGFFLWLWLGISRKPHRL